MHHHQLATCVTVLLGVLVTASCGSTVSGSGGAAGGTTATTSSSGSSSGTTPTSSSSSSSGTIASDGGDDAGYLACMSTSGQLNESLKACQSDGDCAIEQEQTDCCGTILYVGVSTNAVSAFTACEAVWVAHFPGCGCASNKTSTEDGKTSTIGSDAGAPAVHCIDFTMSGGICQTYTP
jgi:hypothetical protein